MALLMNLHCNPGMQRHKRNASSKERYARTVAGSWPYLQYKLPETLIPFARKSQTRIFKPNSQNLPAETLIPKPDP